jgi:ureidoacrylate peracid hydrolase
MNTMRPFEPSKALLDRVRARRGRWHAFETLIPQRTALVVVDMQNSFVQQGGGHAWVPAAAATCPTINRLARGMRQLGGTVVWILNTYTPESEQTWSHFHRELSSPQGHALRSRCMAEGDPGHALYADLEPMPQDWRVKKSLYSAFIQGSSDLHPRLQAQGIDTLLIAGTATNVCCESTARDAMMLNYRTVMVSDACSATSVEEHETCLSSFLFNFGDVQTTDEVLSRLAAATSAA